MREMKESGVEWIGKIPKDWNQSRLKNILKERKENNNPIKTANILSLTNDRGVIPYAEKGNQGNKAKDDLSGYKLAYPNDIILNSMNVVIGSVNISNYFGCVSPVYYMLYTNKYNIQYYNYIFQTNVFQNSLKGLGNGILEIRMRIPMEKLNNVLLPIPNLIEQNKIVRFLDEKILEINNVIEKTKQTIEDYRLYKQAIITKAVTKGLEENVEMKDSGVEWIEKIPKNYKIVKLKFLSNKITDGAHVSPETENGVYDFVSTVNVENGNIDFNNCLKTSINSYVSMVNTGCQPKCGDILISKDGTVGKTVVINFEKEFVVASSLVIIRPNTKLVNIYYLNYFLQSSYIQETLMMLIHGSGLKRVSVEKNSNLMIALPQMDLQKRIVNYLDKKCTEIDNLINSKEKLIEELEQYKKSLIYEYVTGKKEVKYNENSNKGIKINCKDNIFAQAVLLCKIIERLKDYNLGRVKAEKTLYLIENDIGFDFNNKYTREAAGPLNDTIYKCESIISKKNKWVKVKNVKKHIEYEILDDFKKYESYYKKYYSDYDEQIEKIINIIKDCDMDKSEMIATLYASWNDFIITKDEVSDNKIIKDIRENWNDSKKRFSEKEWLNVLQEMKNIGLVPKGYGNRTIIKE